MSTLAEIEAAIAKLPVAQWAEIREWMEANAPETAQSAPLEIFRQLQDEMRLTAADAAAWKSAVADARR